MREKRTFDIYKKIGDLKALRIFSRIRMRNKTFGKAIDNTIRSLLSQRLKENIATLPYGMKIYAFDGKKLPLEMLLGEYEKGTTSLLGKIVRLGDVVLDVGANIGYYTMLFAKLVGPEGLVCSFEPDPRNCAALRRNAVINGFNNVKILQKAVSDVEGKRMLYHSERDIGMHSLYLNPYTTTKDSNEVETTTIDAFMTENNIGSIALVKMDIEGAELTALHGATQALKNSRISKIVTEFCPMLLGSSGTDPSEFLYVMKDMGFIIYAIDDIKGLERVSPDDLINRFRVGFYKSDYVNLFCKP